MNLYEILQLILSSGMAVTLFGIVFKFGKTAQKIENIEKTMGSVEVDLKEIRLDMKEIRKDINFLNEKISGIQTQVGKLEAKDEEHFRTELKLYMRKDKENHQ